MRTSSSSGLLLVLVMGAVAFRSLLDVGLDLPGRQQAESWFFAPDEKSPWLVIGLAAWLIWRRVGWLRTASGPPPSALRHALTAGLLLAGLACFGWAQYTRAADLLLPALSLHVLAAGSALAGPSGCRILLLPAAVLLISMPLPSPMHNEVVWALQRWTASAASTLLELLGNDPARGDAFFQVGDRGFLVVEACSGLRGLEILTLVAVVIREVFAGCGARSWCTVAVAPPLALALNVLRVTSVYYTEDPDVRISVAPGHLGQGLAVLVAGTVLLYLLGLVLARGRPHRAIDEDERVIEGRRWPSPRQVYASGAWAGLLVAVSVAISVAADAGATTHTDPPIRLDIALDHAGWTGRDLEPDLLMIGRLPLGEILQRRYRREGIAHAFVVDLFVAYERDDSPRQSPFSSKLVLPGHGWAQSERHEAQIWDLGLQAEMAQITRPHGRRLVYQWNVRDPGPGWENLQSLLALRVANDDGGRLRAVVRLETPLAGPAPLARDQSRQVLDHFVRDFRRYLADL